MKYKGYEFNSFSGTMTNDEYKYMINILEKFKPKRICELGSGQSTLIFEHYCNKYNSILYSIEHNEYWKRNNTIIFPLIENEQLNTFINIDGNIYKSCNKYEGFENWLEKQDKFDFILIDGPYGFGYRENYTYSRIQLLSFIILNKIENNSYVLYHDSERNNAKTTLNEFERLLHLNNFKYDINIINNIPQLTIFKIYK